MISAPILHVNGDKVDDVARAMKLALAYQQKFRKDVVIVSSAVDSNWDLVTDRNVCRTSSCIAVAVTMNSTSLASRHQ